MKLTNFVVIKPPYQDAQDSAANALTRPANAAGLGALASVKKAGQNNGKGYITQNLSDLLSRMSSSDRATRVQALIGPYPEAEASSAYLLRVFVKEQYVGVFVDPEGDGGYRCMVMAFPCSTGNSAWYTPRGRFKIFRRLSHAPMFDGSLARNCLSFTEKFLFHSVISWGSYDRGISTADMNGLNSPISHGCVRLSYRDSLWLYQHCLDNTIVDILDDRGDLTDLPAYIPAIKVPSDGPLWDPTDPNPQNPYLQNMDLLYSVN